MIVLRKPGEAAPLLAKGRLLARSAATAIARSGSARSGSSPLFRTNTAALELELREGRNRQVRRMNGRRRTAHPAPDSKLRIDLMDGARLNRRFQPLKAWPLASAAADSV